MTARVICFSCMAGAARDDISGWRHVAMARLNCFYPQQTSSFDLCGLATSAVCLVLRDWDPRFDTC